MLPMERALVPLFERVSTCARLVLPTAKAAKVRLVGLIEAETAGPMPFPLRLMDWGESVASSVRTIEPVRTPPAVGLNETEMVQLPDAGTIPQSSVSLKSPTARSEAIVRDAPPILCRVTFCA